VAETSPREELRKRRFYLKKVSIRGSPTVSQALAQDTMVTASIRESLAVVTMEEIRGAVITEEIRESLAVVTMEEIKTMASPIII